MFKEKQQLLEKQKELGEEAISIRDKVYEDRIRSTQIEDTKKRLGRIKLQLEANHEKLLAKGIKEESYFENKYFEAILVAINEAQTKLEGTIGAEGTGCEETRPQLRNPTGNGSIENAMIKRINKNIEYFEELMNEALSEIQNCQRAELLVSKAALEEQIQKIKDTYEVFLKDSKNAILNEEIEDEILKINKEYRSIQKKIMVVLSETEPKYKNQIKLEDIRIPVFFGNISEWPSFHDLFKNLVHDCESFSNAEKMYRLKNYVKGDAGRLIQHLKITDANYEAAWEILKMRFQNNRLLFTTQVDRILDHPLVNSESASSVKQLLDTTNECVQALKGLNIKLDDAEPFIARIIVRKLDRDGLRLYEQGVKKTKEIQTLKDVLSFLEQQYQALEAVRGKKQTGNFKTHNKSGNAFHTTQKVCDFCKLGGHDIQSCRKFQNTTVMERRQFINKNKLCYVCMDHNFTDKCLQASNNKCKKCSKNHNTLLHVDEFKKDTKVSEKTSAMLTEKDINSTVLLATAQIRARAQDGSFLTLRALIDQGSQKTAISEEAAQLLQLRRKNIKTELRGLGESVVGLSKYKVNLEIYPRFLSSEKFSLEALVLKKLSGAHPDKSFKYNIDEWRNYTLADPYFNKSDRVDIVIGGDLYQEILEVGIRKVDKILGQATKLGWILSGVLKIPKSTNRITTAMTTNLERFWEIEEIADNQVKEEDYCVQHFKQNTTLDPNGRFIAKLPFREDCQLGESRKMAMARFINLEKQLKRNGDLKIEYINFMREYQMLGHMKEVKHESQKKYYLPHHAVIRELSTTTKVRVVFDGSAKSSNGKSLNEVLMVGPRLQKDLFDIILKWRLWKFSLCADIEKMFRQIKVTESDQQFQTIIWRENENKPFKEYQLTTVTYGTTCAPFIATMSLMTIADNCKNEKIGKVIREDFYMDDLITGADTITECIALKKDIAEELEKYGFHLRKWISNSNSVIDNNDINIENEILRIDKDESTKTLGLHWHPGDDEFLFKLKFEHSGTITKRKALSILAKIFDPVGWLTPITVTMKLYIQKLWLKDTDWDQILDKELTEEWRKLMEKLHLTRSIRIPRWTQVTNKSQWELHGFADASEKAYGAVIYVKVGSSVRILTAKSKVNPVKNRKTLPKLELCAAHLLARLLNKCLQIIQKEVKVIAWTDSTITLGWIKNSKNKDKFIRNKAAEINSLLPQAEWYHVKTKENPADLASRGISPEKLASFNLWWEGPAWLSETNYVHQQQSIENTVIATTTATVKDHILDDLIPKISNYAKLKRIVRYILRFATKRKYTSLHDELEDSERVIIGYQQNKEFRQEIEHLKKNMPVHRSSKIATLNPFLDEYGILRVGGRIGRSQLGYNHKHPVILDKSSLSFLIVNHIHFYTLHGGSKLMKATISRKYWILGASNTIKKCIRNCTKCIRYKHPTNSQIMGELPKARVTASPPFTSTGIDFAGPIYIKQSKGRGQKAYKGYIAIFVCMSTKAIHLEAVSDLTTKAFLAALKRFFARRGKSKYIYTDNGTNFIGASRQLDKDFKKAVKELPDVAPILAEEKIEWKFIPPAAPHFGGIWEAGVKSVKHHLNRVIGDTKLTFEEISTVLTQIEAVLNSRPLYSITNEVDDIDVLTPSHFLIGKPMIDCPEAEEDCLSSLDKWKLLQKIRRDFWKRWKEEYLTTLQQRHKWKTQQTNLVRDQIVLIKNEDTHPSKWPLGRVIETHEGRDKKVRVVTVKLENSIIKRPIHKLIPLQTSKDFDSKEK